MEKKIKPKKCKGCGEKYTPERPLQQVCGFACAIQLKKKQEILKAQKEKRDWYTENKTIGNWKQELQKLVNSIVRAIDFGQPCIATDNTQGKMNAGHYISVGSNDTIRFNLHNIHIQSEHSNTHKSGDTIRYQDGIVRVYGQEYLDYMNSLKGLKPIKLSVDDIKEAIKKCKAILKNLKENERILTARERVTMRNELNNSIGIYGHTSQAELN